MPSTKQIQNVWAAVQPMVAPRGPAMPADAAPAKEGSHTVGGRGDGHAQGPGRWIPRAGPRIAHGPGTRAGVKVTVPTHDDATMGEPQGRPSLRRISLATTAFAVTKFYPWGDGQKPRSHTPHLGNPCSDPISSLRPPEPTTRAPRGCARGQARDLAQGPQQLGTRVAKPDTTKNPGEAMCSWLP